MGIFCRSSLRFWAFKRNTDTKVWSIPFMIWRPFGRNCRGKRYAKPVGQARQLLPQGVSLQAGWVQQGDREIRIIIIIVYEDIDYDQYYIYTYIYICTIYKYKCHGYISSFNLERNRLVCCRIGQSGGSPPIWCQRLGCQAWTDLVSSEQCRYWTSSLSVTPQWHIRWFIRLLAVVGIRSK